MFSKLVKRLFLKLTIQQKKFLKILYSVSEFICKMEPGVMVVIHLLKKHVSWKLGKKGGLEYLLII